MTPQELADKILAEWYAAGPPSRYVKPQRPEDEDER